MSIFGRQLVTESYEVQPSAEFIDATFEGLQEILVESARESYQLNAGLYISDVIMEEAVIEGAATPEVLLESFVKDTWEKLKQAFQKMWEKVKGWYEKVKRWFSIYFTHGQEFIKKYKNELTAKNVKGFKYKGYVYTIGKGEGVVAGHIDTLKKELAESVDFNVDQFRSADQEGSIRQHADKDSYDTKEAKEDLLSKLGHAKESELLADVAKAFRNGADEPVEIEDFSGNSREEMIAWLEKGSEHLREVEKRQKELDDSFNRVLNSIKAAKAKLSGANDADSGKFTAFATHKYDLSRYALSLMTSLNGVHVKAIQNATKEFEHVLKSFLNFKPAKEAFESIESRETGADSILEAALRQL